MTALVSLGQLAAASWMPAASTSADKVDTLFYFITAVSAFFFALVVGLTTYFAVKYRRRKEGQRTSGVRGSFPIEVAWSVVPSIFLVIFFFWGFRDYMDLSVPPRDSIDVRVTAHQWFWTFDYPKEGINTNELVVPIGRPVKLTMSSNDVIHSFYVPAFRIKRDVLPNRYTVLWFEATQLGEYDVFCAEYCGTNHSNMLAKVRVVGDREYKEWIDTGGGLSGEGISSVDFGKQLFTAKGCATCHSVDGSAKTGPTLLGKYGSTETLTNGSTVEVDDNYLRQSMMDPASQVVQGYQPVMPTYAGKLTDQQVNALIDYMKSIGK